MNQNEFIQYVSNCTEVFYDEPEPEAALIFARALLARAEAAEAEAARLRNELAAMTDDRDQWQAAYADNELYGLAVMQRRDELEAEAPRLRDEVRSLTPRPSYEAMAARVAELEVELAAQSAQGWRDFTERPPIGEQIQIATVIDAVREEPDGLYRIGNTSEWQAWRPAPQEPTQ